MILLTAHKKEATKKGFDGVVQLKADKSIKKWLDNNRKQFEVLKTEDKGTFVILFHNEDEHLTFIHNVADKVC